MTNFQYKINKFAVKTTNCNTQFTNFAIQNLVPN